jgi:glycosyltransferase involved in cell wall biosynthesis
MKVSIITVAFNAEQYIEDAILSVLNQAYSNIEYIIVDGASTDNTLKICKKYKDKISKIISEPDKGIYDAMNKGVYQASGDIIGILNADDFYAHQNVIQHIVDTFITNNSEAVYGDLLYVHPIHTDKIVRTWKSGPYKENIFLKGWMPPHPSFFLKKECYDKYGLYSLDLKSAADYELMLRMLHKNKVKVSYLNEITTKMRTGGVSNSSFKNRFKANREDKKAWLMNGLKPGIFTLIRKPLSKIKQYFKS